MVYDVYSQSYLAILPGITASTELAKDAIKMAVMFRDTIPEDCIIFDGGKQFLADSFSDLLGKFSIIRNRIPADCPWFNGSLESGNKDLKKFLYTILLYNSCGENSSISHKSTSEEESLNFLKNVAMKL